MLYTDLLPWLKWGSGDGRRSRARRRRPAPRLSFVPRLMVLEDRTLPSTFTVLTNSDSGVGSLRAAIADAQSGDQIVFDPSLHGQTAQVRLVMLRSANRPLRASASGGDAF
jgi:hypothetical protein